MASPCLKNKFGFEVVAAQLVPGGIYSITAAKPQALVNPLPKGALRKDR